MTVPSATPPEEFPSEQIDAAMLRSAETKRLVRIAVNPAHWEALMAHMLLRGRLRLVSGVWVAQGFLPASNDIWRLLLFKRV